MRITGGKARGVQLRVPKSSVHRPAMDKLRQAVFSSLGSSVEGVKILDLFAGLGSYGLDAMSRGGSSVVFVEANRKLCSSIKENATLVAKSLGQSHLEAKVICGDALKFKHEEATFDFIFVDPPYDIIESIEQKLFKLFEQQLASNGTVVFEMPGHFEIEPDGWRLRKRLGKGLRQPTCCLYERAL